jgi:triacylglycerol lipase
MRHLVRAVFSTCCPCFDRAGAEDETTPNKDPRINDLGAAIEDDYATIRATYSTSTPSNWKDSCANGPSETPKHPIVLAHGLLGFDEFHVAGNLLPGIQYWRGITEAMRANGIEVITASVPASGSIEERALKLGQDIAAKANGKSVNIIAHSMGGLDART